MLVITKGETGGAQTHLLALCHALRHDTDFRVVIGGEAPASPLGQSLTALGVQVHPLPSLRNTLSPIAILRASRALVRLVRQERPDILHAHSAVAGVVTRLTGRMARVPAMYTVHGFGFKPEAPAVQRQLAFAAEWVLAPFTRYMVCVSRHERVLAKQLPLDPDRVGVIANGIPDVAARASPETQPPRLAMVARFAPPKRQDLVLKALAATRDRLHHETRATLIGDGPGRAACEALAGQLGLRTVCFTGDVADVPLRLASHQVFALASDHEGLPISIIEAMRAGMAIVASDLPGVRELVRPDEEALLVPNEVLAWTLALEQLAASPDLRAQLGAAARRRYETLFTPGVMADQVQALYVQIAAHEQP